MSDEQKTEQVDIADLPASSHLVVKQGGKQRIVLEAPKDWEADASVADLIDLNVRKGADGKYCFKVYQLVRPVTVTKKTTTTINIAD